MKTGKLLNVVSIGGGTGLACLLKGLKHSVCEPPIIEAPRRRLWIAALTAVVTVSDDGGSSGRLRRELQVLPPGDIRNCMVALSMDESLLSRLFQYRFAGSGQLGGHSFGNLFLTALTGITGDFLGAIRVSSRVLAIRGKIYPSTLQDVRLEAETEDGRRVRGESVISQCRTRIARISLVPPHCTPVPAVLEAIRQADIVTVGPGSLYTSLLPNLLVRGVADEIRRSRALKILIGNLMTQPGETTGMTAADHLEAIHRHAGGRLFDGIILNKAPIAGERLERYRSQGAEPVHSDLKRIRSMGLRIIERSLLAHGTVVRHDPDRLAETVRQAFCRWRESSARARGETGGACS